MNKEEIEKAKEELQFFNEGDYITKEMEHSARVLEGYIKELENEIEMYKDFKEIANMKMGDRNVIRAIKNYKTLDKVTEECRKQMTTYEDSILEIFPQKILNIIEGEREYCCTCGVELNSKNKALNNMCNECKYGLDYQKEREEK